MARKSLQRRTVPKASGPFNLGPRYRTPSRRTPYPSRKPTPPYSVRDTRDSEVRGRTPDKRHHPRIMESLRCEFHLRQKERRKAPPCPRLSPDQPMDAKKSQCVPPYTPNH